MSGERCCPGAGSMAHVRGCFNHPEHTPTPVPSEVAETTAGERDRTFLLPDDCDCLPPYADCTHPPPEQRGWQNDRDRPDVDYCEHDVPDYLTCGACAATTPIRRGTETTEEPAMTTPPTPPTDNPMCPTKGCAYPMPHEHAAATASALTVADLSRLYDEALADYEGALVSRDPERRATAEARLHATARALSQAQSQRVAGRSNRGGAPSWDALLSDPTQQLDAEGVVFRSVMPTPPTDNLAAEGGPRSEMSEQGSVESAARCYGHWGPGMIRAWDECPVCNPDDEADPEATR